MTANSLGFNMLTLSYYKVRGKTLNCFIGEKLDMITV